MSSAAMPPSRWKRYRLPLLALGIVGWLAGVTTLHRSYSRTTKGATELLQIGALPVT